MPIQPLEAVLQSERQKLEKLERVREVRTAQYESQLDGAGDYAKPHIQVQFDTWKDSSDREIDETKLRVLDLENRIKDQEKAARDGARAELDARKQQALKTWLDGGGSSESFESAWPAMEQDLLRSRTMDALNGPDQVQHKRERLGGL